MSVRTPRNWFALIFLPVWLTGWAMGEVFAVGTLAGLFGRAEATAPVGFLLLWLTLWTLGGGFAVASFLWMAFGRESVEISSGSLRVRREALGVGRTWSYDLAHVQKLRFSPATFNPFSWSASLRMWGFGNGVIGFDYGASTIRVLPGLDEAEANAIAESLRSRLGGGAALSS